MRKLLFFITAISLILASNQPLFAQDDSSDYFSPDLIRKGIYYYDPDGQALICAPGGNAPTIADAQDNKAAIWNYFANKGLSAEQIAGIIGNLEHESGLNPAQEQIGGPAFGLAQWEGSRRTQLEAYAREQRKPASDLQTQLDFMWIELTTTEQGALNDLRRQTSVDEATKSFMLNYERPGIPALEERQRFARQAYNEFQGGAPGSSSLDGSECVIAGTPGKFGYDMEGQNGLVYYSQTDPRWADSPFGSSTIGVSGCGPTSVAMVVGTLAGSSDNPEDVARKYSRFYVPGSGSNWSLFLQAPEDYGLRSTDIGLDFKAAARTLQEGGLVIVSVSEGTFTSVGHIMVMRKVSEDGQTFYFADPNAEQGPTRGESNTRGYTTTELVTDGNLVRMWAVQ